MTARTERRGGETVADVLAQDKHQPSHRRAALVSVPKLGLEPTPSWEGSALVCAV